MNFTMQIVIERSRDVVVDLIRNPAYLAEWQPEVKGVQWLSGERNREGARSRVAVELRGFQIDMIETIVELHPPEQFVLLYEARGVRNLVTNRFLEEGPERTRWVLTNQFKFSGMMSFVGLFVQDTVPRQNAESMRRFKAFAERQ